MKTLSILAAAALALAGCSYNSGMSSSMGSMPGMMSAADIGSIVRTANEGEVQEGQFAATRASSSAVRDFANMMVSDHTKALNDAQALFSRNGITPADTAIAQQLRSGAQQTVSALGTYSGASFDRTYMQSQVDTHQWLLDQLDNSLIPSARGELRSFLQTQRTAVASHLERARAIMSGL